MKTIKSVRIKPNPAGKDRNRRGAATAAQLGAEWVDLKNDTAVAATLDGLTLYHVAYSGANDTGKWERVQGFTGTLVAGKTMRVHSGCGPVSALNTADLECADYHVFTNRENYIWNNDRGDCSALQKDGDTDSFDKCWYDAKPPEGVILVRVNGKFGVAASSMSTTSSRM